MSTNKHSFAGAGVTEDVTRITGSLPNVDLEIIRREDPNGGCESVSITMHARPGFDAVAATLLPALGNPALLWSQMAQGAMPLLGNNTGFGPSLADASNPFALWQQMSEQMWQPWLSLWGQAAGGSNPFVSAMMEAVGAPLCGAGRKK